MARRDLAAGFDRRVPTKYSAANVAATTHENTTTEAALETYTIPADELQVGSVIRFWAQVVVTDNNSTDTCQAWVKFGPSATAIASRAVVGLTTAVDVVDGDVALLTGRIIIRTIGASGTFVASNLGFDFDAEGAAGAAGTVLCNVLGSTAIDTTVAQLLTVSADWSVAHAENILTCDMFDVEVDHKTYAAA